MAQGDLEFMIADSLDASHRPPSRARLWIWLTGAYLFLAFCCWREVRYASSVEATGKVLFVRDGPKNSRQVRYEFLDPRTGEARTNTVNIGRAEAPSTGVVAIQLLTGANAGSRMKSQARPLLVHLFTGINVVAGLAAGWTFWRWGREAHRRPLTRQQRLVAKLRESRAAGSSKVRPLSRRPDQ